MIDIFANSTVIAPKRLFPPITGEHELMAFGATVIACADELRNTGWLSNIETNIRDLQHNYMEVLTGSPMTVKSRHLSETVLFVDNAAGFCLGDEVEI